MTSPAIAVSDLRKRYGAKVAVDGVSLTVRAGSLTALLGPNGAGKTSIIEICEGFRRADAGRVEVLGLDPARQNRELKARIGVMLQSGGLPATARAGEYLHLVASFYAHPVDPAMLLDRLGLTAEAKTPFRRLSGGQQQRLSLACAVVGRPELVFLDEPTAGLDPQARHATWELVGELRQAGVAVLLSTHLMDEAERLADDVVVLDGGQVVARGTPDELTGAGKQLRFRARPGLPVDELAAALPEGRLVREAVPGAYVVEGELDPQLLAAVTAWCAASGVLADDLRLERRTLEDVFLELTGRELRG